VFNNHGNPFSYKVAAWPYHRLRQSFFGRRPAGNYLTHNEVLDLVAAAGLRIVEHTGCGLISPKLFKLLPNLARKTELWFGLGTSGKMFGVDQIYVAAKL
jgi:hypothetical protein